MSVSSPTFPRLADHAPQRAAQFVEGKPLPVIDANNASRGPAVPLSTLAPGQTGVVCETTMDPRDAALLRAMGLRPNAMIRVKRAGEPCIVEVIPCGGAGGTECHCAGRIGLAKLLAGRVMVARLAIAAPDDAE